ncbi:unnamed protein product [Cryptosporidium hominis]|uniref:Uncharacterized protein n=1 Tax=Cryptosporidium hominis TaxID=237895 RepID=A0A0S4TAA9_CRYHO|nr:hypothetical protein [Cryptosporidium hominis TU502]PPS97194.1 Uncharacterized protein GY17_00001213 [Cryptosporidium hominis]CUV04150.1 unnamed protein product [Cryptosporidium hominis]|eukprot:PPS97194.1 Uncharacterized protein GY17_00001213 [Cryptosporidium hominis]
MQKKRENLHKLAILILNSLLILATFFTIFFLNIGYYRWGFSNGSNVKYSVCLNRIYSEGVCINTSVIDFENCTEIIEFDNFGSSKTLNSVATNSLTKSIKNTIISIQNASLILTCLIATYLAFLSFSTLILLIKEYLHNKRYAHIFSIILMGASVLFIKSGLLYWISMHFSWGKTFRTENNSATIQKIYHSLGSGFYTLIGILSLTFAELIVLIKILPRDHEYSKYSLIS